MEAAAASLSGSNIFHRNYRFSRSINRSRYIASGSRYFSNSDLNTQNHSVLKGPNLSNVQIQKRNLRLQTNCALGVCTFPENVMESHHSHVVEEKLGVLLLNLGGPETLNDVQPFLYNLFADPDIIRLPRLLRFLQRPLAKLISVLRAPKSKEGYAAIGGGSPLRKITDEQARIEILHCRKIGMLLDSRIVLYETSRIWVQADALRMALEAKNVRANVYVGMRYWFPFTEEAIEQIKRDRITKLVVLPLYPQFSISTTGSSIRVLQRIFKEDAYLSRLPVSVILSWYQRQGYINSMADLIEKELGKFEKPEEVMIFFSAHGVPVSYVEEAGDPYKDQMEECIYLIMQELKARRIGNDHTLAYQSRVGPVQWLKPYTDEVLVEIGQKGVKSLLAVPISFVSEHIETLEEIDMEYKHLALESGIKNWGRVPALGCNSLFITDLADAVVEALPSAKALSASTENDEEAEYDPLRYLVKMFFGSILAFLLLLTPKVVLAFRSSLF
ncbi:hypothetical protein CXB51_020957 [Gossypium anomalum]|uniref:Ferrochelatase n=1 Tax=Gossypium anomalum TaxID=47600 RepID=A0A8J6CU05_9ROSI|nr:hypothetical protein CXB51_020957 [Gossypium anomalum]